MVALLAITFVSTQTTDAQVVETERSGYSFTDEVTLVYPAAFTNQPLYDPAQAAPDEPMPSPSAACSCDYFGKCQSCKQTKRYGCRARCKGGCKDAGSLATRDRLFGNTFGPKSALAEKGIVTDFILGNYYQGVTTGGNEQTAEYGGKLDMYFDFVGEKFGFNKGLNLIMHVETRWGSDISSAAGPLTLPQAPLLWPLPGDYHGINITGLFATQAILDGKAAVLAGKLNTLDLVQGIIPEIGFGRKSFMNVCPKIVPFSFPIAKTPYL